MNSLLQAIVNIAGLLPALTALAVIVAFISGLVFFSKAIYAMAKPANSQGVDTPYITTNLVVGTMLITLGGLVIMMTDTLFGTNSVSMADDIFSYAPGTIGVIDDATTRTIIRSIVGIIQFIGLLGIIRSGFLFSAYSKQAVRSIGPAITFLVAGTLAMNFPRVVGAFSELFM